MSDIFKYQKLTDFEKVLFLEHQVKEMLQTVKAQVVEIGLLKDELSEKIDSNVVLRQRNSLRQENHHLRTNRNHYKMLFEKELLKNQKK